RADLSEFEGKVQLTYLTDLPLNDLIDQVRDAPEHSVVLYIRQSQDVPGYNLTPDDVLTLLAQSSSVPIYGVVSSQLGRGIIGGYLYNTEALATQAGELALRIAKGARPQDIPVTRAATIPTFDWRQLLRWGVSEHNLPAGSLIKYRPPSFWEQHRWQILGCLSVSLAEAALIAGLLVQRARRRRGEAAHAANQKRLAMAQETGQVGAFDWDLASDFIEWPKEMMLPHHRARRSSGSSKSLLEHVHPDDYPAARRALDLAK